MLFFPENFDITILNRIRLNRIPSLSSFTYPNRLISCLKMDSLAALFLKIGLSEEKAIETAANKKIAPLLERALIEV